MDSALSLRGEITVVSTSFSGTNHMRSKWMLCALLGIAGAAYAKEPKPYQTGKLVQMDSVQCGTAEKNGKSFSKKTDEVLCQEYVLQSDKTIFRIRPRDEKHPVLLPVGERAQFRMEKDKMLLRVQDLDNEGLDNEHLGSKEREYIVVSMTPRSDSSTADVTPVRLNHLQ